MLPFLKIALPVTADVGNRFSKFERCIWFSVVELTVDTGQTGREVCNA